MQLDRTMENARRDLYARAVFERRFRGDLRRVIASEEADNERDEADDSGERGRRHACSTEDPRAFFQRLRRVARFTFEPASGFSFDEGSAFTDQRATARSHPPPKLS